MKRSFIAVSLVLLTARAVFANQIYAHVSNGVVDNRAVFPGTIPSNWPDHDNWYANDTAQIGWSYSGGVFSAPPPPAAPTPSTNPADYPLQRYQFDAMLQIAGLKSLVASTIAAITDPVQRDVAQAKYDDTQVFQRNDALLVQLAAAAGLTPAQVDGYWMQAKDL